MADNNPFFSTNMPLGAKRTEGRPEALRSVSKDNVKLKAFPRQFQSDPGALPEPRRVIMSSDLRRLQDNKERLRVAAERKAAAELRAAKEVVDKKAAKAVKKEKAGPKK